jgi:hypothetical protein
LLIEAGLPICKLAGILTYFQRKVKRKKFAAENAENTEKKIISENLAKSTSQSLKNFVAIQLKP